MDLECSKFRPMLKNDELERPEPPFCAESNFPFQDEFDFNSCKRKMIEYQSDVRDYLRCLVTESDKATEEYNEAVSQFNQRTKYN